MKIKVNLTIDDTECAKMDGNGIDKFPSGDLAVLVLEICSKSDSDPRTTHPRF